MKHSYLRTNSMLAAIAGLFILAGCATVTAAPVTQSAAKPTSAPTAAFAATPAASAESLPRTTSGRPDLSGAWAMRAAVVRPPDPRGICVGFNCGPTLPAQAAAGDGVTPAGPGRPAANFPKYKLELLAKVDQLNKEQVKFDPALRCGNPGLPRIGPPDKIVQTSDQLIMLYDDLNGAFWRIIPTDGRAHREDAEEGAFGDSVGNWEGDKLVIETVALGDETWLTDNGAFHTYNTKVIEELSPNGKSIDYKLTVYDPEVLAEPWVKTAKLNASAKEPLQPVPCVEKSIDKMVGIESYHPNARW